MSVEIFSKEQFEQALPTKGNWYHVGLIDKEHTYRIPIVKDDIEIEVRSSVNGSGWSAETGQDSIRCWLVDGEGKPLGSKVSKWITRIYNWDKRMIKTFRTLWEWARWAGYCSDCQIPMGVFKVKKNGPNKGKIFKKCRKCNGGFEWLV